MTALDLERGEIVIPSVVMMKSARWCNYPRIGS
jgi:hypothetical protein